MSESNPEIPEDFCKVCKDFIADILTTFSIFLMLFCKGPVKIKKNAFIIWALLFLFSAGLAFLFTSINLSTDNLEFIKAFLKLCLYILNLPHLIL